MELRWLKKEIPSEVYHDGIPITVRIEKVLQYRYLQPYHDGRGRPIWSEWQDVPEVEE